MNPFSQSNPDTCCEPGDVTLTNIPRGFLIGRAVERMGNGPWWEFIAIVRSERDALHHAATLARVEGTRAWRHVRDDDYEPLT
jgi:hypothetical protein